MDQIWKEGADTSPDHFGKDFVGHQEEGDRLEETKEGLMYLIREGSEEGTRLPILS